MMTHPIVTVPAQGDDGEEPALDHRLLEGAERRRAPTLAGHRLLQVAREVAGLVTKFAKSLLGMSEIWVVAPLGVVGGAQGNGRPVRHAFHPYPGGHVHNVVVPVKDAIAQM